MVIDEVTIKARAGKGGDGVVRWRQEKGRPLGGPSGGDGGRGGDIVLRGVRDLAYLARYQFVKEIRAKDGENGRSKSEHGASGDTTYIDVPVGSLVTNKETKEVYEILHEGEEILLLKGGLGGLGNEHFKGSTNQYPTEVTKGKLGFSATLHIELQMIADVGFIGLPNAGKSSLLNALTNARSQVGNYAFTTLEPHLGEFHGYILADIPGLIEGASSGKGLGDSFLRHIRRTRAIVHLVSSEEEDVDSAYRTVRTEIEKYDTVLGEKREIILLSKVDIGSKEEMDAKVEILKKHGKPVHTISVLSDESINAFASELSRILGQV